MLSAMTCMLSAVLTVPLPAVHTHQSVTRNHCCSCHARLQAALARLLADMRRACMPAATVQLMADMARHKGRQLPEAEYATQVSLEALRLEDPAAMFGCWNPG